MWAWSHHNLSWFRSVSSPAGGRGGPSFQLHTCYPFTHYDHGLLQDSHTNHAASDNSPCIAIVQVLFSRRPMLLRHSSLASFCIFHCNYFPWLSLYTYCQIVFVTNCSSWPLWQANSVYNFLAVCKRFLLSSLFCLFYPVFLFVLYQPHTYFFVIELTRHTCTIIMLSHQLRSPHWNNLFLKML